MDKEQQLEEMAKDMCGDPDTIRKNLCANCLGWSDCLTSAEALYAAGYRKQSDVVKEFAKRIKDIIHRDENISNSADEYLCDEIDDLNRLYGKDFIKY